MKFVICKSCQDMIVPEFGVERECNCGKVKAFYSSQTQLVVREESVNLGKVIAIANTDIIKSMNIFIGGENLKCWMLPDNHEQITRQKLKYADKSI